MMVVAFSINKPGKMVFTLLIKTDSTLKVPETNRMRQIKKLYRSDKPP
jgi:hypothetical protein